MDTLLFSLNSLISITFTSTRDLEDLQQIFKELGEENLVEISLRIHELERRRSLEANMSSNSSRCAACKYLRRRCAEDCVLSPYFPSTDPERFSSVHKIFGAGNVSRMLQQLPMHLRGEAANAMSREAEERIRNPVYGIVGGIHLLQQQILRTERELAWTRAQVDMHSLQVRQQWSQQHQHLQHQQLQQMQIMGTIGLEEHQQRHQMDVYAFDFSDP